jgi:hypothetical protein
MVTVFVVKLGLPTTVFVPVATVEVTVLSVTVVSVGCMTVLVVASK